MTKKTGVKKEFKMMVGMVFLIVSGIGWGFYGCLMHLSRIDESSIWILLFSFLTLVIGVFILLHRDSQLRGEWLG